MRDLKKEIIDNHFLQIMIFGKLNIKEDLELQLFVIK